jgi:3-oxoacyl-[acyl-carrier-protein] synthase-3
MNGGVALTAGLIDLAVVTGSSSIDTREPAERFGISSNTLRDKIGFTSLRRKAADTETSDLAVAAAQAVLSKTGREPNDIGALIVVTQNPDGFGLPHTSAIVQQKLGLPGVAAFDISLGCSGFVYGLATLAAFSESYLEKPALLVTADPYSKVVSEDDRETALLFGDGAAAALIGPDPVWRLAGTDFGTDGSGSQALHVDSTRHLRMNGRAVFNFSMTVVPDSIRRAVERAGLTLEAIDRFVLHQGSRYIVESVAQRLGIADRCAFSAAKYGNLVSSAVPAAFLDSVGPDDRNVVICGFGVGLSWASAVLVRR